MMTAVKKVLFLCIVALCALRMQAQNTTMDFAKFREGLLSDFQTHRKHIFDNYDEFLTGVWRDYETFRSAPSPFVAPKPVEQPRVPVDEPVELPDAPVEVVPDIPQNQPDLPEQNVPDFSKPTTPTVPNVKPVDIKPTVEYLTFDFYGAKVDIPRTTLPVIHSLEGDDLANAWKQMTASSTTKEAVKSLGAKVGALALPDWFVMELATSYAQNLAGGNINDAVVLFVHYTLSSMGYNVRLGRSDQGLILLAGMEQMVYARSFITIDDIRYYICLREDCNSLSTCDLPADAELGRCLDLVIRQAPRIPSKEHGFSVGNGRLSVTGSVDANLMEMLRRYPQMPIPCYAASSLQRDMRQSIVGQLRVQVQGMSHVESVNALLHFVQSSFEYATDDQQFGYEKPFFLEELFYWPKCDCEDRSVLYVYLLRECLGLECHLINYPGHECAAVCMQTPVDGMYYDYEGCRYYISDPTYIGAYTGMCMPDYQSTPPKIEKWY